MNRNDLDYFHYDPNSYQEKVIDGVKVYRDSRMLAGCWMPIPTPIERVLGHIQVSINCYPLTELLRKANIAWSSVSRCRSGAFVSIPDIWFGRLAEISGIPEDLLYKLADQRKKK